MVEPAPTPETPDVPPAGFTELTPLGAGAFGRVYRALAPDGRPVALKILSAQAAASAEARWRFAGEYRRLARLGHPGIPAAVAEGLTPDGRPFYAMALVAGEDPSAAGPLPPARVREVLAGLADVLVHVHDVGFVHGDLKPENLKLAADGGVHLLDVGMMTLAGQRPAGIAGTPEYLAPECFRLAPADPAADMYALGALAFALWVGRPPFHFDPPALAQLIRAHLQAPPPLPPDTPADPALAELIARLLAKDPAARPSARGVLAALGKPLPPGDELESRGLRAGELVGRDELLTHWDGLLAGKPGAARVLVLTGGKGSGKSRALDELRVRTLLAERRWLGAAAVGGAEAPAAPLRAVVAQALSEAGIDAPLAAAWARGETPVALEALEPAARKVALLGAAGEALAAAARVHGLAIGLDDWHLADPAAEEALLHLLRATAEARVVWAIATGEGKAPPGDTLELAPLDPAQVRALVGGRLGAEPPAELEAWLAAAAGNPLLVDLTLEHLVATRQLRRGAAGWRLEAAAGDAAPAADLTTAWRERLGALPADARTLAAVAAVAGPAAPFPLPRLGEVAGLTETAALEAGDALLAAGLLAEERGRVRLSAPGLREVLRAELSAELRATWAGALAQALLPADPLAPGALAALPADALAAAAELAAQGPDDALAAAATYEAGRRALALGAPAEALRLLDTSAARLPADAPAALRRGQAFVRAEAARQLDRLAEAAEDYRAVLAALGGVPEAGADERLAGLGADDAELRARAAFGLSKCQLLRGDGDGALVSLAAARRAADEAGSPAQRGKARLAEARLRLFRGDREAARALAAAAEADAREAGDEALRAQTLNLRGVMEAQSDPGGRGLALLGEAIAIGERVGDRLGVGFSLDNLGNAHLASGDLPAAAEAFARFARICREAGSETELISARLNQARVAADLGRLAEARTLAEEAARRAEAAGRKLPLCLARAVEAQACWRQARLAEAHAKLDEALAIAEELGNKYVSTHVRLYRLEAALATGEAQAVEAELAAAEALIGPGGAGEAAVAERLALARAERARRAGELAAARALLEPLTSVANRATVERAHEQLAALARAEAGLAAAAGDAERARERRAAARGHAEAALAIVDAWDAPWHAANARLARARAADEPADGARDARIALDLRGDANPFARAGAVLLLASLPAGARRGDVEAAAEALRPAVEDLEPDRRAALLAAWELEALAPHLDRDVAAAQAQLALAIDPEELDGWIDALDEAEDETAIAEMALRAVMMLARADRGYALAFQDGRLRQAISLGLDYATEVKAGFSHSIAEHVLFEAEPVYLPDAGADAQWGAARSVVSLGLKTVIALPLATRREIIGVLYMDRARLDPLLEPADLALLMVVARAAASAIRRERRRVEASTEAGHWRTRAALAGRLAARAGDGAVRGALLDAALALTGATRALWLELGPQGWTPAQGRAADGRELAAGPADVSQGVASWVAEQREALALLDAPSDEDWRESRSIEALGLRTIWCVPANARATALLYLDAPTATDAPARRVLDELEALVAYADEQLLEAPRP